MPNHLHNARQEFLQDASPEEYETSYHLIYDREHVIDARRHGNLLRYINHSCRANCVAKKRQAYGVQVILIIAKHDIAAGVECTIGLNPQAQGYLMLAGLGDQLLSQGPSIIVPAGTTGPAPGPRFIFVCCLCRI